MVLSYSKLKIRSKGLGFREVRTLNYLKAKPPTVEIFIDNTNKNQKSKKKKKK